MAVLKYKIDGHLMNKKLVSHANQPGHTILRIGTQSRSEYGEDVLCLPDGHGIADVHAWIYETKSPPLFVLVSRESSTWVNQSPVSKIKILTHNDHITLGDSKSTELVFQDEFVKRLEESFECKVCYQTYGPGDLIFICPKCLDRKYCYQCVVHGGLKCHCGYDFRIVIRSILVNSAVKKHFPAAPSNRLVIETLNDISPLIGKICLFRSHGRSASTSSRTFKAGDEIIYCPECTTPFHLDCWLQASECTGKNCKHTPIQKKIKEMLIVD